jgi:citronellol/citronellal dehydrogenase
MTAPASSAHAGHYGSVFRANLFQGQVMWVTGGGSGIGRCVAHELAALGAQVVISGRSVDKLARVAAEIVEDGGRCDTIAFDIRDEDAVKAGVATIVARHGSVQGLVNNAGGQFPSPLMAISKKGFDAVVANNLTGGFLMMREVFNQSMERHGGAIVNMTADFRNGMPGMGHSGAARSGMSNLTMTAAFEWAHAGVRINAVAPGWIASSGMDTYGPAMRMVIPKLKDSTCRWAAWGWKPRSAAPSSSCCHRQRPSSPASRCRSTAPLRWAATSSRWARPRSRCRSTASTAR